MTRAGVALAVALSARRLAVGQRALSQLAGWADDYGVAWVLQQVDDDPGLLWLVSAEHPLIELSGRRT